MHFRFVPESINQAGVSGEGHAHPYLNGEKIGHIYGNWYYLANLPSGHNVLTVDLDANNHAVLTYHGQKIEATACPSDQGPAPSLAAGY